MSLNVALTNAISGLRLNQAALDVAAQNVANVNTEGYSRKIVQQQTVVLGGLGSGVEITAIARNVNEFLLKDMRAAVSQLNDSQVQDDFYSRMQDLFGSLKSDTSISAYVTNLATRFQSLVNAPEDVALRSQVVAQADLLAQQFQSIATELQELRLSADRSISDGVTEVQAQLTKIHELNVTIAEHKALGLPLTDLQDQRDIAINKVSEQMGVNYFGRTSGEIVLMTEAGRLMVDRTVPTITHTPASSFDNTISWNAAGTGAVGGIDFNNIDITSEIITGRIAGLIAMRDTALPNLASQMEELAGALQNEINALHNQGTSYPGNDVLTGTRTMLGTEQPPWTGTFRVAALDANGLAVESLDINLAGLTVNGLIAQINTMTDVNASLVGGKVVIQPTNAANKVAVNEMTSAVTLGNRTVGASAFLGLNDFYTNGADYDVYGSDYQAGNNSALGIAGTMTAQVGAFNVPIVYTAADTLNDVATKINAAMAANAPPLAVNASVDASGGGYRLRITADTSTGLQNFFMTDAPTTPTGVITALNMTVRDGRMASTMAIRSDIKTDPSRVAHGQLASGVLVAGAIGITTGDNRTAQAISNKFNSEINFSPAGLLSGSRRTLADYGAQILALNASQARNAADLRSSREFLAENLANTVASASGVNLDEEMANLIILQNAYAASARVIDITSQMFDALAQIVR